MSARSLGTALFALTGACGGSGATSQTTSTFDASPTDSSIAAPDSGADATGAASSCPTTGTGAIDFPSATCLAFTPVATGASSLGENATSPNYALAPAAGGNGQLVLFLNGSGSHPIAQIASPTQSFYTAAAGLGYHVLAISYRSDEAVASQCACADACYFPTRQTVVTGTVQPGAATILANMRVDESVAGRATLALAWLVGNDPAGGWGAFLTSAAASSAPDAMIDWTKVVAAGHSQGGGHAAAIGKLYPTTRVVQLSSTCDEASTTGACPLDPSKATPASWTSRANGAWQTPATAFWGLDIASVNNGATWVSGDGVCPVHAAIWQNEGMATANANDGAALCGATTLAQNHNASITCADNFAAWQAMLR